MDRRLIRYYERELRHLETVAKEFAREFPKIAGRLAIEDFPCADPYVERLLEGFAFLTARVQLKLDAEFPRFTQNLLETVYPHYLAPTPSMCVVHYAHDTGEAGLADGFKVPRGCVLRSAGGRDMTPCEYRSAHEVNIWPVQVVEARYYTRDVGALELNRQWGAPEGSAPRAFASPVKAALRFRLKATAGLTFAKIKLSDLTLYLKGADATPFRIYEHLFAHALGVVVRPPPNGNRPGTWQENLDASVIRRVGFSPGEALLPYDGRSFQGYRLLHEYFAFPQRFCFARFEALGRAMRRCESNLIDVIVPLSQENVDLEGAVSAENFLPNCSPAVNLFPKRSDRIFVSDRSSEFQVIPDRTKPLDYEVYRVTAVTGFGSRSGEERTFRPFYAASDADALEGGEPAAYYAVHRVPRVLSEKEKLSGRRTSYAGSEVYVSLVDAANAPYSSDLKQLAVVTLCTNRDLPLQMPVGKGRTDFSLDVGGPVESVRIVAGPTPPRPSHAEGEMSWRLVSHLSLNYLSLADEDQDGDGQISATERQGASALRALLKLYGDVGDPTVRKQIEGIRQVTVAPITRRVPSPGQVAFARGIEITVTCEEAMFEGTGVFVLGAAIEQFFARYVSMNSFTETVIRTVERGEVMRWTAKVGQRPIL